MAWFWLGAAALFEIAWTLTLKASAGFSRPGWALSTVLLMVCSLLFLGLAVRGLPIGTAYAVWTGLGTLGAVIGGIVCFGEAASLMRLGCVLLILLGVAGLKLTAPG